ncbi:MAG TPA: MATE family efflux transporter [Candidatus Krumholzibacteria bacterium]|nr:MATE family efflux transporter [Candidatus Krumholzibacteria bacterium]HRX50770.1 MATE family efflux transporter [Candidatus Krumholzibacteria bacterium]
MASFLERMRRAGRRPEGGGNPILDGPEERTLLGLSIPMILAMLLVTGFGLVDMLYLGRFSREAMAAVALAFPISYLIHSVSGALGQGATSLTSRLTGADRDEDVRNLLWHVLLIVGALSVVLAPLGWFAAEPVLRRMGAEAAVTAGAITYTRIAYLAAGAGLVPMVVNSMFRGEGDTMFPFKVMAVALGLNVVLDPVFIFGLGPIPRLGVAGAAITTASSFLLAGLVVLNELRNPNRKVRFDRAAWRWDPSLLRGLAAVSAPAFVANISMPVSAYLITSMLTAYGTAAIAAFGAGTRLLSFVFLPTLGISMSMMIMVGQNHGAGKRQRVRRITLLTLRHALTLLAVLAVPVILFPEKALGVFTDEPSVIAAGAFLARWVTVARPMLSVVNITSFWFHAQGNGLMGMVPNFVMRVLLEPLGVWLGLRWGGLHGGWTGMALADALGGVLCLGLLLWRLRAYTAGAAVNAPAAAPAGPPA